MEDRMKTCRSALRLAVPPLSLPVAFAGLASLAALAACGTPISGDLVGPETPAGTTSAMTLDLDSAQDDTGTTFRLRHAPARASYHARYPNPFGHEAMKVTIGPAGDLESRCTGADGDTAACAEPPFYARARSTPEGKRVVTVTDLFGETVAVVTFPGAPDTVDRPTSRGSDRKSGGDDERDPGVRGSDDEPTAASEKGDPATCNPVRDAYCATINDWLQTNGKSYRIDCARLSDLDFQRPNPPPPKSWSPENPRDCQDIRQRPSKVMTIPDACGDVAGDWYSQAGFMLRGEGMCTNSPLVLDLDGDGVQISSPREGILFDMDANGQRLRTAWPKGRDALLVLDRNGNGTIDDATELFGDVTGHRHHEDGFAALAELDADGDGRIDRRDPVFGELRLWIDADRDGRSQPAELSTLDDAGVRVLELSRVVVKAKPDAFGTTVPLVSGFVRQDGTHGSLVDAYFSFTVE